MALRGSLCLLASASYYGSMVTHTTIEVPLFPQMMEEATGEAYNLWDRSDEEQEEKETW